jgi:hypothetical protein
MVKQMVMTPTEEIDEKVKEEDQESPPVVSWCPRCEAANTRTRVPMKEGSIRLKIVKGVTYRLEEIICRSCGLFYENARAIIELPE